MTQIEPTNGRPQMLTIPQLEQLKILPGRAIRRLVAEKKIPTVKVGTRVYINRAVFERYLSGESFCLVEARGDKLNEL